MAIENRVTARVLDAALTVCISDGLVCAQQIIDATRIDPKTVGETLAYLVKRGSLVARPGGYFARVGRAAVRIPGSSYPGMHPATLKAMTAGRA